MTKSHAAVACDVSNAVHDPVARDGDGAIAAARMNRPGGRRGDRVAESNEFPGDADSATLGSPAAHPVLDPFGHRWNIGHDIGDVTPAKIQRRYDQTGSC